MTEIRMTYFFLPMRFEVQTNPGGEDVVIRHRLPLFGSYEFLRVPVNVAFDLADHLETGIENATANHVVKGLVGEVLGASKRLFGTAYMRVRILVKRADSLRFAYRTKIGLRYYYGSPTIAIDEARRFSVALREANAVLAVLST